MIRTSLQFAIYIAIVFRPVSFARKISLEDENIDIREFNEFTPRKIPSYHRFEQSKRDGEKLEEVACMPHPEVIQVEPGVTDERNTPQFVMVKRCKGACDLPLNTESCTPSETRIIPVLVTFADGTSEPRDVEEHLACACKCRMDCKPHHEFDEGNCRCNCIKKCKEDENQDPMTCACDARAGKRRDEIMEY